MKNNNNNIYKIVLFGSSTTGKSAITIRFLQNEFIQKYDPTIEDFYRKTIKIDNDHCTIEILDTAGSESFSAMRDLYIKSGDGFILVYSIISKSSFKELYDFYSLIKSVKDTDVFPCLVIGNKCDLEDQRIISINEGEDFANHIKSHHIEASAKIPINVQEAFINIIKQIKKIKYNNTNKNLPRRTKKCYIL